MTPRANYLLKSYKRFFGTSKRLQLHNHQDQGPIQELARQYKLRQDRKAPSLKASLSLFGCVALATIGFGSYKLFHLNEPFFLPLWISVMARRPYKSELDCDKLKSTLIHQLQMRISLTDTATELIGVACKVDELDPQNEMSIKVKCSTPGVSGIYISPNPVWTWGLSWCPFVKRGKKGPENLMSEPSGGATSTANPRRRISDNSRDVFDRVDNEVPIQEAVVYGKLRLRSSSVSCHKIDSAYIEFHATKNLDLPGEPPKIHSAYLIYEDPGDSERAEKVGETEGTQTVQRRLW